jgi:hypothetical protein
MLRELAVPDPDRFGPFQSLAVGVGHVRRCVTAVASVIDRFAPDGLVPPNTFDTRPPVESEDSGVGHIPVLAIVSNHEDPVAEVRGTDGRCRDAVPFRVVPELGQVSEYSSEAQGKVAWHVLQQRPSWS